MRLNQSIVPLERLMLFDPIGDGAPAGAGGPPDSTGEGTMLELIVFSFDFFWWLKR